jgi:hypothetical protein
MSIKTKSSCAQTLAVNAQLDPIAMCLRLEIVVTLHFRDDSSTGYHGLKLRTPLSIKDMTGSYVVSSGAIALIVIKHVSSSYMKSSHTRYKICQATILRDVSQRSFSLYELLQVGTDSIV